MYIVDLVVLLDDNGVYIEEDRPFPCLRKSDNFFHPALSMIVTVMYVPVPAWLCISPLLASGTCSALVLRCFPIVPWSCQKAKTACIRPVAPTGWPQARRPPEGFTGTCFQCPGLNLRP